LNVTVRAINNQIIIDDLSICEKGSNLSVLQAVKIRATMITADCTRLSQIDATIILSKVDY
jgi:hypothetical protein